MALVELGVAVLADKLRQSWVLVDGHPQQVLEVPDENALPWGWSLGDLPRCPGRDAAEAPCRELPVAEAAVPHGKSAACSWASTGDARSGQTRHKLQEGSHVASKVTVRDTKSMCKNQP